MKNRRKAIMSFLLIACLIMGLGYAAFSDVMDITGTAEIKEEDAVDGNIIFTKAEALPRFEGDTVLNTANVNPNNPDKAAFTVVDLVTDGEKAQFKFTITNTNPDAYKISVRGYTNNTDANTYYTITDDLGASGKEISANGGTLEVIVTVELTQTPTTDDTVSASFLLELLVEPVTTTP